MNSAQNSPTRPDKPDTGQQATPETRAPAGTSCPLGGCKWSRWILWGAIFLMVVLYLNANRSVPAAFDWVTDFEAGLAEAQQTDQPVMAVFHADWCGPCKQMERNVFSSQQVGRAVEAWTPVKIDVDRQPRLAERYEVSALPTTLLLSAEGEVLARRAGYMDADELIAFLRDHVPEQTSTAPTP